MPRRRPRLLALVLLGALTPGVAIARPPATETPSPCALSAAETAWIQQALDGWRWVLDEALRREPRLPWIVLYDDACVWELNAPRGEDASPAGLEFDGRPVPVRARPHDGTILLPNGQELPPAPIAAGFLLEDERGAQPFFALASVDLWRKHTPAGERPELERFFLGVAAHEMVHTLQLVELQRRIEALAERHELPEALDDDIVQNRFGDDEEFRAAYERERDLLYRAALAADDTESRELAAQALELLRMRRARFYRADDAYFGELENLFLNLEGLAVWSHYRLALASPTVRFLPDFESDDPAELVDHARRRQGYWSQEEGFALVLLLDRLASDWRRPLLDELAAPVDLLAAALDRE